MTLLYHLEKANWKEPLRTVPVQNVNKISRFVYIELGDVNKPKKVL